MDLGECEEISRDGCNDINVEAIQDIDQLREAYRQKDKAANMAAKIGQHLLDENNTLTQKLEARGAEHTKELERLEQEKYSLEQALQNKKRLEKDYEDEVEHLKNQLKKQKEAHSKLANNEFQAQVSQLKQQLHAVNADLERSQLSERQLTEKCAEQEELVHSLREQLEAKVNALNETCSEEIAQLHSEVASLQSENMTLTSQMKETARYEEQFKHEVSSLKTLLAAKDKDLEEQQCQSTGYYNALEKCREEVQELKVELELLKVESQDQKAKGNSLFSEVEDRRVEAERELCSLKVHHKALEKQHETAKYQLHILKQQMISLLHMGSGRADRQYIESLQTQLSQYRSEVDTLNDKLQDLEKHGGEGSLMAGFQQAYVEHTDQNFVNYLKTLLSNKEKELSQRQAEVRTKQFMLLAESEKLIQCERKLYSAESNLQGVQSQNLKLKMKVEELQLKYEPEKLKSNRGPPKKIAEKININPEDKPEQNNDKETAPVVMKDAYRSLPTKNEKDVANEKEVAVNSVKDNGEENKKASSKRSANDEVFEEDQKNSVLSDNQDTNNVNPILKSVKVKKVSMSDVPHVIESKSQSELDQSQENSDIDTYKDDKDTSLTGTRGRIKGRRTYQGSTKVNYDKQNQCKAQ